MEDNPSNNGACAVDEALAGDTSEHEDEEAEEVASDDDDESESGDVDLEGDLDGGGAPPPCRKRDHFRLRPGTGLSAVSLMRFCSYSLSITQFSTLSHEVMLSRKSSSSMKRWSGRSMSAMPSSSEKMLASGLLFFRSSMRSS